MKGSNPEELEHGVWQAMLRDYQPHGGMVYSPYGVGEGTFMQPMVLTARSSPDLLSALKVLVKGGGCYCAPGVPSHMCGHCAAKAVIAEAEGATK